MPLYHFTAQKLFVYTIIQIKQITIKKLQFIDQSYIQYSLHYVSLY